jgi:hypothetical protein
MLIPSAFASFLDLGLIEFGRRSGWVALAPHVLILRIAPDGSMPNLAGAVPKIARETAEHRRITPAAGPQR